MTNGSNEKIIDVHSMTKHLLVTSYWYWWTIGAPQLTVICYSTLPVTVWSLPSFWHPHHPNVVGGASLQCSQDGRCTTDSCHLQGPFWWGVHLPWLSGVLDSVGHSSLSKSPPLYWQSWRSALHTRSGPYTGSVSWTCKQTNIKESSLVVATNNFVWKY